MKQRSFTPWGILAGIVFACFTAAFAKTPISKAAGSFAVLTSAYVAFVLRPRR